MQQMQAGIAESTATANAKIFPRLAVLVAAALAVIVTLTQNGRELSPRHHGGEGWVAAFSLGLGVVTAIVMLRPRPRTWRSIGSAVLDSIVVAFIWCPVAGVTLDRVQEWSDFAGVPISEDWRNMPIGSASIRYGKGTHYHVGLSDYHLSFDVDPADYYAAFGDGMHVRPSGYCVRVLVQTAGRASRVLSSRGFDLPAGSLVRCASR